MPSVELGKSVNREGFGCWGKETLVVDFRHIWLEVFIRLSIGNVKDTVGDGSLEFRREVWERV